MSDLKYDIPKMLREWADHDLGRLYQGNRGAHLGYIAAKALDEAAARIRELEADLARVTKEREAEHKKYVMSANARDGYKDRSDTLAAKLARCEGLLRTVRERGISAPTEEAMDAYFAEKEPRT